MSEVNEAPKKRRRVTRKGAETPYLDPTPDDAPDLADHDAQDEGRHDDWLRAQKPPHHGN